jgi:hypothetical protein
VHSVEVALGLLEQYVAHNSRLAVAVTVDRVNVTQKGEAVAAFAVMYEAYGLISELV